MNNADDIVLEVGGCWRYGVGSNCVATTRSTSLERKLRLHIEWNEFKSSGIKDGFFQAAVTRACFSDTGRIPDSSDELHMTAKTDRR